MCSGHNPTGDPPCAAHAIGDACKNPGRQCDPATFCNTRLLCTNSDPQLQPGGCPISKAEYKKGIDYLEPSEVDTLASQVLAFKLATWQYKHDGKAAPTHLGFIIDDVPGSAAVAADGDHVDLYGYTSLAVAALQQQQRRIDELEAKLAALEARLPAE